MAVKELNTKEQHYADTQEEAENVVMEAKKDMYLTSFGIKEKHNKYGTYYLIDLKFDFDTPKEIMENGPGSDEPMEEPHEGVEYNVDQDGIASVIKEEDE